MDFRLSYRGPLRANRGAKDKHKLRVHFHAQLKELWNQLPLSGYRKFLEYPQPDPVRISVIEERHGFRFAPLVSNKIKFGAALDILLLRPEPPGTLFAQAGDLDNRVKTLLDALKVPHEPTALPRGSQPSPDQEPFFCLLQDDSLITDIRVNTDRLLEPVSDLAEVLCLVRVRTIQIASLMSTAGL